MAFSHRGLDGLPPLKVVLYVSYFDLKCVPMEADGIYAAAWPEFPALQKYSYRTCFVFLFSIEFPVDNITLPGQLFGLARYFDHVATGWDMVVALDSFIITHISTLQPRTTFSVRGRSDLLMFRRPGSLFIS